MGKYRCNIFVKPCSGSMYKLESGSNIYEDVLTWRVLRWTVIPGVVLLALVLLVCLPKEFSQEETQQNHPRINSEDQTNTGKISPLVNLERENIVLDKKSRITYHLPLSQSGLNQNTKVEEQEILEIIPEADVEVAETDTEIAEVEDDFDMSESKPATLSNRRIITSKPYVQISTTLRTSGIQMGDRNFVDKLISSFDHSSKTHQRTVASQTMSSRASTGRFFSTPGGLLNKKIPNGHKYGEYQSATTKEVNTVPPRVSPTLPSSNPTVHVVETTHQKLHNQTESACLSPRLSLCRGILPWDLTATPVIPGISTSVDLDTVIPYFEMLSSTGCSARIRQFLCSLLEPECRSVGQSILPPCRKPCRAVEEECRDFILDSLDLSQVFNCDIYPDSDTDEECVNLAKGHKCLKNEFQCSDGTCIPWRWVCDSNRDCQFGEDETNCTNCKQDEFRCSVDYACIPLDWKCDNRRDCSDGSDEFNCQEVEVLVAHSKSSLCPSGELRCVDSHCITVNQICDGVHDCSDGADEANCSISLS